jgi:hypothetical protein
VRDLFEDFPPPESGPYDRPSGVLPYVRGSQTSREAAELAVGAAETDRRRVLAFLRQRGAVGATDGEIQQVALSMGPNGHRARRIELCERGLVRDSGRRRWSERRPKATVWVAVL